MMNDSLSLTGIRGVSASELTCNSWYDGSLKLVQAKKGLRATTDAVLLAASVPTSAQHPLELGAGAGAVCLAFARRCEGVPISAVEIDPIQSELLRYNIIENGFIDLIKVHESDACASVASWHGQHDVVLMNPPYNDKESSLSSDKMRRQSMAVGDLGEWIEAGYKALLTKGYLVMISRTDRLAEILSVMSGARRGVRFGDISIKPVHSFANKAAGRVLLLARKDSGGGLSLLPPLILRQSAEILDPVMYEIENNRRGINLLPEGRHYRLPRLPSTGVL